MKPSAPRAAYNFFSTSLKASSVSSLKREAVARHDGINRLPRLFIKEILLSP
jgi:hypothetical protein